MQDGYVVHGRALSSDSEPFWISEEDELFNERTYLPVVTKDKFLKVQEEYRKKMLEKYSVEVQGLEKQLEAAKKMKKVYSE